MARFGLLKSKQEREHNETLRKIQEFVFPNGNAGIQRDATRVNASTPVKIPLDHIQGFTIRQSDGAIN